MTNYGSQYLSESELRALPFKAIGRDVLVHSRANLIHLENIALGDHVRIDGEVTILATGAVSIGSYVHIGAQCYLAGVAGIELHDFSGLSQGVKLYSGSDDYSGAFLTNPTVPKEFLNVRLGKITLGRHVIIGAGSIVMPGVTLGEGCAVGALSLVKRDTDPWGIYVGVPATRKGERSRELLALERTLLQSQD